MNILIITSYFAPDTAVAAVRPYMFAKYLSQRGHKVTVIRSGEILASIDTKFDAEKYGIRVISYLGENSEVEKYKSGKLRETDITISKSRISFLPVNIRQIISKGYHTIFNPIEYKQEIDKSNEYLNYIKKTINNLKGQSFDIVISTYGRLENVFAGCYAKEVLGCNWIMDLRDRIAHDRNPITYRSQFELENRYMKLADACTIVSKVYCDEIKRRIPGINAHVIYNGYDEMVYTNTNSSIAEDTQILTFCYTGSMYTGKLDCSKLFQAISLLINDNKIDENKIRFYYAGREFEYLNCQAQKYKVEKILINKGYLNKSTVNDLQRKSDIFVVAARNFKPITGEITGKFYEGIRAHKPILALITGNLQHSELWEIEQIYNYGYCYERCGGKTADLGLYQYIQEMYDCKQSSGICPYNPKEELFYDFRYDFLTEQLENIMNNILNSKMVQTVDIR